MSIDAKILFHLFRTNGKSFKRDTSLESLNVTRSTLVRVDVLYQAMPKCVTGVGLGRSDRLAGLLAW